MLKRISAIALIFVFAATTFCLPASAASSKVPAKTKIIFIRNTTDSSKSGSVVVKFKKVKAYGYLVRYATNSKYKNSKIKWVSGKKSEVKVTGLKLNKKYYFKVLSYNKKGKKNHYSKYSGSKTVYVYNSATKSKINSVKASFKNTKATFTIKYSKVKYATGYRVQCSTTSDFKKVHKEVFAVGNKNTTAVISGLKPNAKYYFRVRAYQKVDGMRHYGRYSEVKTGQYSLYAPKISSVSTTMVKNKVRLTVKLNKVSYATGYCIYISTDKNFKKNVKTVWNTGINNLTAKVDGFKTNTVYYVKARAYYKAGKNRTYGNYSSVKSVQMKVINVEDYINSDNAGSTILSIARRNWGKTPDWNSEYCGNINLLINPNIKVKDADEKVRTSLTKEEFEYACALYKIALKNKNTKSGEKILLYFNKPVCNNTLFRISDWMTRVLGASPGAVVGYDSVWEPNDYKKYNEAKYFADDFTINTINENEYVYSEAQRIVTDELKLNNKTLKIDGLKAVYDYIGYNYRYDDTYTHYSGYDMLKYKHGVCNAYGEVYELLCRTAGIDVKCQLLTNVGSTGHLINYIKLRNEIYYTDSTCNFCDGRVMYDMYMKDFEYAAKYTNLNAGVPAIFGATYYAYEYGYMMDYGTRGSAIK